MWSPCSTCDAVGIRLRYGYCTVSLLKISKHKYFIHENGSTMNDLRHIEQGIKRGK